MQGMQARFYLLAILKVERNISAARGEGAPSRRSNHRRLIAGDFRG